MVNESSAVLACHAVTNLIGFLLIKKDEKLLEYLHLCSQDE